MEQSALTFTSKAANGPPAMQLLKNNNNKQTTTRAWEAGKEGGEQCGQ